MNFYKGDMVMHWSHGIGQIVNLEERALAGSKTIYYVVQMQDMTVWVPADSKVGSRLRPPTPKFRFQRLLAPPPGQRLHPAYARQAADRGYRNLHDQMLLGGHGVISVTANVAPKLMSQMCAAALGASDLAGGLRTWLEARHGRGWWRDPAAGASLQELWSHGSGWSARDVVAHLGYNAVDWRPVLRQVRTQLIGEMSGYGGPNITTRAGTRKV